MFGRINQTNLMALKVVGLSKLTRFSIAITQLSRRGHSLVMMCIYTSKAF